MIIEVDKNTLLSAAEIHSEAWRESHRGFCSKDFIEIHTVEYQKDYLMSEIISDKKLYMLIEHKPVGIVSVKDNLIENLYILPTETHNGYGTKLLLFAIGKCTGTPCLWILDNNKRAFSLYSKHGFKITGNKHRLSDKISEIEMQHDRFKE